MAVDDLKIQVDELVKTKDAFGKFDKQLKGIAGTLHLTSKEDILKIGQIAWDLAEVKKLPVVIVVRASA